MVPSAKTVIDILAKLEAETNPAVLAYWITPNVILTLSGARAYCDGVFYNSNQAVLQDWTAELNMSVQALATITRVYWAEVKLDTAASGDEYAGYEVVLGQGLENVIRQTGLLPDTSDTLLSGQLSGEQLVGTIAEQLKDAAAARYSKDNLRDIAFGILVGYPDKAITGSVTEWQNDDPFKEPLIDADIRGAGFYICPQPVYTYPRHLVNDPEFKHMNGYGQLFLKSSTVQRSIRR